jgi:acyl dehydratase
MMATTRTFTLDDQLAFAALAGDFNPIHVDPLAARRLIFGEVVVHGVHAALWALDDAWRRKGRFRLAELGVTFRQPLRLGAVASYEVAQRGRGRLSLRIRADERVVADVACSYETLRRPATRPRWPKPEGGRCRDLTFEQASAARGEFPLKYDARATARRFPRLTASLPDWQLAVILAADRLLGMECPGRNSIFSGFRMRFTPTAVAPRALSYHVAKSSPRFSSLLVAVEAPGVTGELSVSYRPAAVEQAAMSTVARLVEPGEFSGIRALVVGGSRGLGEVTAKLVAAGGGEVRLSYHVGARDAARVVGEIRAAGGVASSFAFDVLDPGTTLRDQIASGWKPTHLFYFPTPFISLNETTAFSPRLFGSYCRYYVEGFLEAFQQVSEGSAGGLAVFYPSSRALEEVMPKAIEYASAKAAGETACLHLQKLHRGMRFHFPRLPRMLTDRTATVLPVETQDPVAVLLEEIRRLSSREARGG